MDSAARVAALHQALYQALEARILVLDGAMGTMLQQRNLTADDFGGPALEGCNENLVRTRPDVILDVHRAYFAAGSDIVETNSFGSTALVLAEYGLGEHAFEISRRAAELARQAADEFSTPQRPRWVAGSIGPTTKAITVTGGVTFEQLRTNFHEQASGLIAGGADLLLVETCQDTRNIKAALLGIDDLSAELGRRIPVMVSGTIEPMGTMLAGQTAEALWVSLEHADLLSIGLNCATGPEFMTDHLRTLHTLSHRYVSCYPNAGLPNEDGKYAETPESLAAQLARFVQHGWVNIVGGCCGTTPAHITALAAMVQGAKPRQRPAPSGRAVFSGIETIEADDATRPLIVGERTNVVGSRLFKQMVAAEQWEEATEIARRQVKNGAHIIDVCLQSTERDELTDVGPFYEKLIRKIKAPVMIDTTDVRAIEAALTYCQGKGLINSVNLEDGEEKFERVCPLARRYGAALVVGCIDEDPRQAQAFTRERKLAIAQRSVQLLTEKYGIPAHNIALDPLVFPCATGDENYIGGAVETIEGVRLIKQSIPGVKTVLGISNVSFGLPAAAREIINSVFLYHCTKAGLDLAIVNAEKLERFASIPEIERHLAEALLFNTPTAEQAARGIPADWREQSKEQRAEVNQARIAEVAAHFRQHSGKSRKEAVAELPLDERLGRYIIEGTKDGLVADLERKRLGENGEAGTAPLDIINGPLMAGMAEVGRLFNNNELIVAEVLQSAEAMKAAVNHLEQFMEKSESATKGRVVLGTVKGDVHDIGKNLVEIILANNGYQVINLGIKVPPETFIEAVRAHQPDAVGFSGLLVKSAGQMVSTAGDLRDAGIAVPLLVGGAALSERFTRTRISPEYAGPVCYSKDAMSGLALMNALMDPAQRAELAARQRAEADAAASAAPAVAAPAPVAPRTQRSSKVRLDVDIPVPASLDRFVRDVPQLHEVWSYINPLMLYRHHLGFKGQFEQALADRDPKALELFELVEEIKRDAAEWMKIKAVWQFFQATPDGNAVHLRAANAGNATTHTFTFERQDRPDGLCLADYVLPPREGKSDHIALMVVTAGGGVRERAEIAKQQGRYVYSHGMQVLALESAEAAAEWLHRRIREDWGFPDAPEMTMKQRHTSRYRGKRYAFGYPACPRIEDQAGIWKLLHPEEIGVELTDGFMMEPEASTSALVFHHPDCAYYAVSDEAAGRIVPPPLAATVQ